MTATARHSPENRRPITLGRSPQALRTPHNAPVRAGSAEIQPCHRQIAASPDPPNAD